MSLSAEDRAFLAETLSQLEKEEIIEMLLDETPAARLMALVKEYQEMFEE